MRIPAVPPRARRVVGGAITVLAALIVLAALVAPDDIGHLTPAAFLRLPVEALVGIAVLFVLPRRPRLVLAGVAGTVLGLLAVLKAFDIGFSAALDRPFDPVLDWGVVGSGVDLLAPSIGPVAAVATAVAAGAIAVGVVVLTALAALRVTRATAHRTGAAARAVAVLVPVWGVCSVLGTQLVPDVPVASASAAVLVRDRVVQVGVGLRDQEEFATAAAVDPWRDVPGDQLLTALRGKDVVLCFVESYGRDAVQDPEYAPQVGALLAAGDERLASRGFASRSAFLTSPTYGGGSWLAHATLQSGLWVDSEQRYKTMLAGDRLTLSRAAARAGWRSVAVMPGVTQEWPEGDFYGYQDVHDSTGIGYRGPNFGWAPVPDQYTLDAFDRLERTPGDRTPVMAEIPLVSSHWPWAPLPRIVGWDEVGDGTVYQPMIAEGFSQDDVWDDPARVRTEYRRSVEYSLESIVSWVEARGDDDLVLVFLGDHQPIPAITGDGASRDVPITVVTRDRAVLDRIAGWGWDEGLKPSPGAPVWRMDAFRDRFLTTFSPGLGAPAASPAPDPAAAPAPAAGAAPAAVPEGDAHAAGPPHP